MSRSKNDVSAELYLTPSLPIQVAAKTTHYTGEDWLPALKNVVLNGNLDSSVDLMHFFRSSEVAISENIWILILEHNYTISKAKSVAWIAMWRPFAEWNCIEILKEIEKDFTPTPGIYSALLEAHVKCRDLSGLEEIVDMMQKNEIKLEKSKKMKLISDGWIQTNAAAADCLSKIISLDGESR